MVRRGQTNALLPASSTALALEETLSPVVGSFFGPAVASGVPVGGSRMPVVGRKFRRLCESAMDPYARPTRRWLGLRKEKGSKKKSKST